MSEEIVKGLRFVLLTQAALLFLGFTLVRERSSAKSDMLAMEQRIVALKLLNLSASQAKASEHAPDTDEDTEKLNDAWRYYEIFSATNELEGLGQVERRQPWNLHRETAMIGGGRLYFTACSTLSGAEADLWRDLTSGEEMEDDRSEERLLFLLPVQVEKGRYGQSDILSDSFRLIFTNWRPVFRPWNQDYVAEAGPLRVKLPEAISVGTPRWRDADMLEAEILKIGRRRGVLLASANECFLKTLSLFENERAKIPILDAEVGMDNAFLLLLAVSVGLAAWGSFLMRTARVRGREFARRPWIFLEPLAASATRKTTEVALVTTERLVFLILYLAGILAPIGLAILPWLANRNSGIQLVWLSLLGLLAFAFALSILSNYLGLRSICARALTNPNTSNPVDSSNKNPRPPKSENHQQDTGQP